MNPLDLCIHPGLTKCASTSVQAVISEAYKGGELLLGDLDGGEDDLVSQENRVFSHKVSKYFKTN
jgi:hypothetical protein